MGMFLGIDAAASGLTAERLRMDVISNNIANANTTRTQGGGAYHRRYVVFQPREKGNGIGFESFLARASERMRPGDGVRALSIETDRSPGVLVYEPGHPDANAEGYVERPNVNIVSEMVDMISASRGYEANATTINAAKSMVTAALRIGGGN